VFIHEQQFVNCTCIDKFEKVRLKISPTSNDKIALIVTKLDDIACKIII